MERTMSVEERIKRAEDIYNRRNGVSYSRSIPTTEKPRKKRNVKKLLTQIFVCLLIYVIFYAVSNREHVFSLEFRNEVNDFLTEKTKISEWYSNAKNYFKSKFSEDSTQKEEEKDKAKDEEGEQGKSEKNDKTEQNSEKEGSEKIEGNENISKTSNEKNDGNIGGASEVAEKLNEIEQEENEIVQNENKELSEEEQMKKDVEEIKSKISFMAPIHGRISSTFGWRNPTTASVPKYHTGLDIAANEGTIIKSATDGKVTMASSQGDYGNHYRIEIEDIVIIYAHCKKLYLKEGDIVKQGQEIAEVGSTGNSTGPHLHLEIRKGDKKIDPQLILNI